MPSGLADLVVDLGEGALAVKLLPQLVVQGAIKHFPEFFPVHVAVGVEHLEPAGGEEGSGEGVAEAWGLWGEEGGDSIDCLEGRVTSVPVFRVRG